MFSRQLSICNAFNRLRKMPRRLGEGTPTVRWNLLQNDWFHPEFRKEMDEAAKRRREGACLGNNNGESNQRWQRGGWEVAVSPLDAVRSLSTVASWSISHSFMPCFLLRAFRRRHSDGYVVSTARKRTKICGRITLQKRERETNERYKERDLLTASLKPIIINAS